MKMYLITYRGKPNPDSVEAKKIGGAYINCWIKEKKFEKADAIARKEIGDNNWRVENLEEVSQVSRNTFLDDAKNLEYFEQALIDKTVFVYHTYPKNKKNKTT